MIPMIAYASGIERRCEEKQTKNVEKFILFVAKQIFRPLFTSFQIEDRDISVDEICIFSCKFFFNLFEQIHNNNWYEIERHFCSVSYEKKLFLLIKAAQNILI